MTPASYNISIPQKADFSLTLQLKNSDGSPINLTGYTIQAQVWTTNKSKLLASMVVNWVDRTTGKFTLSIPYSITSQIDTSGVWDLLVVSPIGHKDYWIRGKASLAIGYTDG